MQSARITTTITAAQRIGQLIHDLRKERNLTGGQLAQMARISQSRISKIENAYSGSIDTGQVETLLDILKPTKIIRQQISMLLFQVVGNQDGQFTYTFMDVPEELNSLQRTTTLFRSYVVSGVSAVFQTVAYRTALLKRLGMSEEMIQTEIGHTMERQDALWDPSKKFHIIMPESALYTMGNMPQVQLGQLDRLERMIGVKNIYIGVIPVQAGATIFETASYSFYDDNLLYITVGDRLIRTTDTEVLVKYLSNFEEMTQIASFNTEAIELIRKAHAYFAALD